jgi:hypothetical protein
VVYRPDYVQRLLGEPDADPPGNPSRRPRASDPEAETPN